MHFAVIIMQIMVIQVSSSIEVVPMVILVEY